MLKKILAVLIVLLWAGATIAATPIGKQLPKSGAPGYYIDLKTTDEIGLYQIGNAFALSVIGFTAGAGSAFTGGLYACTSTNPVAFAGCDLVLDFLENTDYETFTYQTHKRHFILDIKTAEDISPGGQLVIKGTFDQVAAGGGGLSGTEDITTTGLLSGRLLLQLGALGYDPLTVDIAPEVVGGGIVIITTNASTTSAMLAPLLPIDGHVQGYSFCLKNFGGGGTAGTLRLGPALTNVFRFGGTLLNVDQRIVTTSVCEPWNTDAGEFCTSDATCDNGGGEGTGTCNTYEDATICFVSRDFGGTPGWISMNSVAGWVAE